MRATFIYGILTLTLISSIFVHSAHAQMAGKYELLQCKEIMDLARDAARCADVRDAQRLAKIGAVARIWDRAIRTKTLSKEVFDGYMRDFAERNASFFEKLSKKEGFIAKAGKALLGRVKGMARILRTFIPG